MNPIHSTGRERVQVAVFVDGENILVTAERDYGFTDHVAVVAALRLQANSLGEVVIARFYGDTNRHSPELRRVLQIHAFQSEDVPLYQTRDGRTKSSLDAVLAHDLLLSAFDYPSIQRFLVVSGDRDYMRVVSTLRHRFHKQVIVMGLSVAMSEDLIASASEYREFRLPGRPPASPVPAGRPVPPRRPAPVPHAHHTPAPLPLALPSPLPSGRVSTEQDDASLCAVLHVERARGPMPFPTLVDAVVAHLGLRDHEEGRQRLTACVQMGALQDEVITKKEGTQRRVWRLNHAHPAVARALALPQALGRPSQHANPSAGAPSVPLMPPLPHPASRVAGAPRR